jgi:hypothetical protein
MVKPIEQFFFQISRAHSHSFANEAIHLFKLGQAAPLLSLLQPKLRLDEQPRLKPKQLQVVLIWPGSIELAGDGL